MARKKKRTGTSKTGAGRRRPPARHARGAVAPVAAATASPAPEPVAAALAVVAGAPAREEPVATPLARSASLIDLGLHVAAVPFVVPLYVTAAISRKLGLHGR
jgi:hypothetical protein